MNIRLQTLFETPAKVRMTARQYLNDPRSEQKSDLIEGVFVMASPASFGHESVVSFVFGTLLNFVESKGVGRVLGSNVAYQLSEDNVFQPDVSFILAERLHLAEEVYFPGPPDIAVEVISPSSRLYDTVEKKINYGRFGVGEYWLIDPIEEDAVFYRQVDGQLLPIPAPQGQVQSQILAGCWLEKAWLFPAEDGQRPSVLEVAKAQGIRIE